jgi:hypothetical protein
MNIRSIILLAGILPLTANGGLLALWKLDSSPADELEDFPTTWGGSAGYTTTTIAPHSGAAANLDGTRWLEGGSNLVFERNSAFSASAWIKGNSQDSAILGDMAGDTGNKGWEFHVGSTLQGAAGNSLTLLINNDYPANAIQVNATVNVLNGNWHHVVFTYDGSSTAAGVKIYVDGQKANTTTALDSLGSDIASNGTARFNIGSRSQGTACNFTGVIDEIALFNHALNESEVIGILLSGAEGNLTPSLAGTVPQHQQIVNTINSAEVRRHRFQTLPVPLRSARAGKREFHLDPQPRDHGDQRNHGANLRLVRFARPRTASRASHHFGVSHKERGWAGG